MEEPVNGGEIEGQDPLPQADPRPEPAEPAWQPAFHREGVRRRALRRRLAALLGTGTLAFTLTTWLLLRHERSSLRAAAPAAAAAKSDATKRGSAPSTQEATPAAALRTARALLEALNHDDPGAAYSSFSPRYRAQVSLAAFRRLVHAHRDMFHTEEQEVKTRGESADRVVLDIHVSSDDDEDYIAQFTLVRVDGRWSVDDLHWAFDESDSHSSA